jgi:adenosylmethionine-8-amino-7-oxononanoate aminotransferase
LAVQSRGLEIMDSTGQRYLDASSGAAVSCLGHAHPSVIAAIERQLHTLAYAHTAFFTSEAAEQLAHRLVQDAPGNLDHVLLVSGGSEAVEAALKMARQYFVEKGEGSRRHVIARRQSYHGNTLGALAAGGNEWRRQPFEPLLFPTHHIAPCFAYRFQQSDESDAQYAARSAHELEEKILDLGSENVVAFIAEPIVGATAGAVPAVGDYFRLIRDICTRHGVLLILDEVMCGMGRSGTLHACEQEGIVPDLMTIAKGLAAGYQPIGAVLLGGHIFDAFAQGSGYFQHGHTYMAHPTAAAAALAVQEVIRSENLLANVQRMGALLRARLDATVGMHPNVGDIRGRGLLLGVELVADRHNKAAFAAEARVHRRVKEEAMQRGLMIYTMGGTIDGRLGDHLMLAPPFIIDSQAIDLIVERLQAAIEAATAAYR